MFGFQLQYESIFNEPLSRVSESVCAFNWGEKEKLAIFNTWS